MDDTKERDKDAVTGQFKKGNRAALKHGAYSLARTKNVPSIRGVRELARYITQIKANLEKATPDMNVKKELLINQVIKIEEKICFIDMWLRKTSVLRPDKARKGLIELQPVLANSYLAFLNSQRLALMALGIGSEEAERAMFPYEIEAEDSSKGNEKGKKK